MRDRSKLHYTKLDDFLRFVEAKGYELFNTKGMYEAFRIKKDGKFVIGHKRDKSDHITIHGHGLFLIDSFLKEKQ